METSRKRRQFLASIGITGLAGLAGCTDRITGNGDNPPSGDDEPNHDDDPETEDEEPDDEDEYFYSGETIPPFPYEGVTIDPLETQPDPEVSNPVFTADSVDQDDFDDELQFAADPYMFVEEDEWHMFVEVVESGHGGRIVHAESDDRGVTWDYTGIVLEEEWHLSFPLVFKWEGDYYMTTQANPSSRPPRLYKANSFPGEWYTVVDGYYDQNEYDHRINDHAVFHWDGTWWDIACHDNEDTYIYYNDQLEHGGWQPHEENPVVEDRPFAARPGGRPLVFEDRIFVPFQQTEELYGETIQGYWITDLTTDSYEDEHIGTVLQGTDRYTDDDEPAWNSLRMHHYDAWYLGDEEDGWRAVVDGDKIETSGADWTVGMYRTQS